jgi:hypothetical protein
MPAGLAEQSRRGQTAQCASRDGVAIGNQAFDLGLTKKYKWAGDGGIAESINLRALGSKIEGFVGINRYLPILDGLLDTPRTGSSSKMPRRASNRSIPQAPFQTASFTRTSRP